MKIVRTFAKDLFAFHFKDETENELLKVFKQWNDPEKMTRFLCENKSDWISKGYNNLNQIRKELEKNAEKFEDVFVSFSKVNNPSWDELFAPLYNSEYKTITISKRKAKYGSKENFLRFYALKIDANCYVITGGAIKFTHLMEERVHTQKELEKLEKCRNFLKEKGVVDEDSFYDFLIEENDQ